MNWLIVLSLLALVVALWLLFRRRMGPLAWLAVVWLAVLAFLLRGFQVPIPHSVVKLYMGILTLALLVFASADRERWRRVKTPVLAFLTEARYAPALVTVAVLIPAAVAAGIYIDRTAPPVAPAFGRTVHPAPPSEIEVGGETLVLGNLPNPYRALETSDPDAFREHVAHGRQIYYHNCFYCHGDLMRGAGLFAHGLNPIPTNFQDKGNLPGFQESFLFWRISKGGAGLPTEGGPWDSAMPVWEQFLTRDDMWDVILFLYDFTGLRPRAVHEAAGGEGGS
jgi:hypothetical protein